MCEGLIRRPLQVNRQTLYRSGQAFLIPKFMGVAPAVKSLPFPHGAVPGLTFP